MKKLVALLTFLCFIAIAFSACKKKNANPKDNIENVKAKPIKKSEYEIVDDL